MADAADSKSVGRKAVWVRLPPPAPARLFSLRCSAGHSDKGNNPAQRSAIRACHLAFDAEHDDFEFLGYGFLPERVG